MLKLVSALGKWPALGCPCFRRHPLQDFFDSLAVFYRELRCLSGIFDVFMKKMQSLWQQWAANAPQANGWKLLRVKEQTGLNQSACRNSKRSRDRRLQATIAQPLGPVSKVSWIGALRILINENTCVMSSHKWKTCDTGSHEWKSMCYELWLM